MPLVLSGDGAVGPLSATEVSYLDGVTSAVQTQLNGKLATPGAWSSYTPQLGNGWANGNATATGKYTQIGKIVFFWIYISIGSTTTKSANQMTITLPVSIASTDSYQNAVNASVIDSGTNGYVAGAHISNQGFLGMWSYSVTGSLIQTTSNVTSTSPFTWATSDEVHVRGFYEAA